jgi:hypothetical protein
MVAAEPVGAPDAAAAIDCDGSVTEPPRPVTLMFVRRRSKWGYGASNMDDFGRAKFEAFRLKLLLLSAAVVVIPSCFLSLLCGGGLGRELMVEAGWELQLMMAGMVLAGVFLFLYVMRFMRLLPTELSQQDGGSLDEQKLVRKLVTKWHLSVPERSALPKLKARASLACQAIVDVLSESGWFPSDWRPDQGTMAV